MVGHAQRDARHTFCTGAFHWREDGSVTDVGWVADLVKLEIPVGDMLCGANPARVSETYDDLLKWTPTATTACGVNYAGSPPQTMPDGTVVVSPCSKLCPPVAVGDRREFVEGQILKRKFNTNYIASWFLVRSEVVLDANGNPKMAKTGADCTGFDSVKCRNTTRGPLTMATLDTAKVSGSFIPLLADAASRQIAQRGDWPFHRRRTAGEILHQRSGDHGIATGFHVHGLPSRRPCRPGRAAFWESVCPGRCGRLVGRLEPLGAPGLPRFRARAFRRLQCFVR